MKYPLYTLKTLLLVSALSLHAAAIKEVKKEDFLTVAGNNAFIHTIYSSGVTEENIGFIHQRLSAGADVHACAENGWNILHYLAISGVENRTIFPLIQTVINSSSDKKYKLRRTPEGKTAEELAKNHAVVVSPFKQMYHARALVLRDFGTNPVTALALHLVLSSYSSNETIAKEAQAEIAALKTESPEEYVLVELYLHDKPEELRTKKATLARL